MLVCPGSNMLPGAHRETPDLVFRTGAMAGFRKQALAVSSRFAPNAVSLPVPSLPACRDKGPFLCVGFMSQPSSASPRMFSGANELRNSVAAQRAGVQMP